MRNFASPFDGFRSQFGRRRGGGGAFTARFGDASNNATGTGAFDTSIYQIFPPPDGTYGEFTVASGVITPSGAQTVGTYDVGGYPVEVVANLKAVANQTEANAVTDADAAKTILVREAAGLTITSAWNSGTDFGWATILGDGPDRRSQAHDASKDALAHFVSFAPVNVKKLILDRLNVVTGSTAGTKVNGIFLTFSGGGNTVEDIQVRRCRVIASRPGVFDDFSGGVATFPGSEGIRISGNCHRCGVYDCVVIGAAASAGAITVDANGWVEAVGNKVDLYYNDGIRLSTDGAFITGGNLVSRALSVSTDTGNPHSDPQQHLGGKGVIEASAYVQGDARGAPQSLFIDDGTAEMVIRDLLIIDNSAYQLTNTMLAGSLAENCIWLPRSDQSLPIGGTMGGVRFGSISATGTNVLRNSVFRSASSIIDGTVTQAGNVNSSTWAAADYTSAFPAWAHDPATIPSLSQALTGIAQPSGAGAAAGKGPRVAFTGADQSNYTLYVSAPTISISGLTPTSSGFTATVNTDTELQMAYWAAVPAASPTPTYREIKERRASGGVVYGSGWVSKGDTSVAISDTSTLSPSTNYKLCVVQENGWSVQSSVVTAAFTTAAAGVQRIAAGPAAASNSTGSLAVTLPACSNGDYMVLTVEHRDTQSVPATPSGWTIIGDGDGWSSGSAEIMVFGRVKDGTEGATVSVVATAARMIGQITAYRNVSGVGATATEKATGPTTRATPTVTATAGSAILHIWAFSGGAINTLTLPNPADLVFKANTPDQFWHMGMEDQLSVGAGVTTARTATAGAGTVWNAMQIELLKA